MTWTSVPNLDQTEPISNPIYPPPTTTIFFGSFEILRAPVDERIFFSSKPIPGSDKGSDPVLIIVLSVSIVNSDLSFLTKISFFPFKRSHSFNISNFIFFE